MIFSALSLVLMLHTQNLHLENEEWEGKIRSDTQSVEVTGNAVGSGIQKAVTQMLSHRQLSLDEIKRQRVIKEYGLRTVLAWELTESIPAADDPFFSTFAGIFIPLDFSSLPDSGLVTMQEVANLGITGGNVSMQPSRGWAYINKPVYLQSNTAAITKETTILGTNVTITATPVSYTWHCGDGHSFTTKDGGGTWPNGTVTYSYTRSGTYTLSADITWRASYTVNGNTYPIDGTLTTTSTAQQLRIVEAEAVLRN